MLLNEPPDNIFIRTQSNSTIIKIRRELWQLYQNDFFVCVKKAFPS